MPPPGVEVGAQVLDIAQRYRPDFVHRASVRPLAGGGDQGASRVGLSAVEGGRAGVGLLRGRHRGGRRLWRAEGYHAMQFAGAGDDYPVRPGDQGDVQEGRQGAAEGDGRHSVYYNRGLQQAAVHVEAIRNALKATGGKPPTGEDIKKGFEQISDFTLGGLVPPLEITPTDHEGGGWVQIFQVKGGKFVKETDWFRGYRDWSSSSAQDRGVAIELPLTLPLRGHLPLPR